MVSNVQNSAQPPPLSYADRVKKSQRANAAPSTSAPRPQARAQPPPAGAAAIPNAAKAANPPAAEPLAKQQPQGDFPAPSASQPSSPDTPRKAPEQKPLNGQPSSSSVDPVAGPSSAPAKKPAAPPAVNVWSLRKERMAQVLSQQTAKSPDSSLQPAAATTSDSSTAPPPPAASSSAPVSTSAQKEPEASSSAVPTKAVSPDVQTPNEEEYDPWVVRPNRASPAVAVPAPRLDATSWPEVGKAHSTTPPQPGGSGSADRDEKGKKEAQGSGQRRAGEKTKWVPIPVEELRAAADAQRTTQSSANSRPQSQQRPQASSSGSTSRSAQGSQERSKASNGKGQNAFGSASHSEAHSRTGSIQSSPKHPSTRLRRIPDEGSQSRRSSRANSPRPYPGPNAIPPPPPADAPQVEMPQPVTVNGTAYYPSVPQVPSSYGMSTPPYPPPPGSIHPMYNPAAYAPYAPYPYPPPGGHPYMYWSMPQDPRNTYPVSSQSQSPATHPSSLARSSDVTPPTSVGGPSPGEERPEPIANAGAGAKDVSKEAQKPSRRQRLLSFGSIRADGEIVGEGEDEATRDSADKPGTLGLSLESLSISNGAEATPRTAEQTVQEVVVVAEVIQREAGSSRPQPPAPAPHIGTSSIPAVGVINGDEQSVSETPASARPPIEFGTTGQAIVAEELTTTHPAASVQPVQPVPGPAGSSDLTPLPGVPLRVRLSPLGPVVNPEGLPPTPVPASAGGALYANNSPVTPLAEGTKDDELRVRDYGFGFGRGRYDPGYVPRDDRGPKDRPYYGGRGMSRGYDEGYRGGFRGRRGRGASRGYGRGGRGREYAGGRGSYPRYAPRDVEYDPEDPMGYMQPVDPTVYYGPPVAPAGFVPPAFDMYQPYAAGYPLPPVPAVTPTAPVPTPVTKLSFPLDPTRYYLLGQLEYYLSEDNMAQDFYLRKHMNSEGWISVMLLASFPRVKTLTYQLQLVKDVLTLSSLVEVSGDSVRPYRWQRYVLPDAAPASVDAGGSAYTSPSQVDVAQAVLQNPPARNSDPSDPNGEGPLAASVHVQLQTIDGRQENAIDEVHEYEDDDDEDDDDVVFVLGKDAGRAWTPERRTDSAA
ncbi:LAM domain-containing protein [Phanerochaete sordida]|uniref:LAM domain-containing protein n=1 Tax=Phanerochaete sordida TaxID=48140 RepID=A0A9P3L9E4_9APHY|nr:LAM domain-containing protein [Phanerochaete sordida]